MITPSLVKDLMSGGVTPSFRYLLRVSLEGETKTKKKAAVAEAKQGAKKRKTEMKEATRKAKENLADATSKASAAKASADKANNEYLAQKKNAKKGTKVNAADRDATAKANGVAGAYLQKCQAESNQVQEKYADKATTVDEDVVLDKLEDAGTSTMLYSLNFGLPRQATPIHHH